MPCRATVDCFLSNPTLVGGAFFHAFDDVTSFIDPENMPAFVEEYTPSESYFTERQAAMDSIYCGLGDISAALDTIMDGIVLTAPSDLATAIGAQKTGVDEQYGDVHTISGNLGDIVDGLDPETQGTLITALNAQIALVEAVYAALGGVSSALDAIVDGIDLEEHSDLITALQGQITAVDGQASAVAAAP